MTKLTKFLILLQIIILSACSSREVVEPVPPPYEAVSAFFEHLQEREYDEAQEMLHGVPAISIVDFSSDLAFKLLSYELIDYEIAIDDESSYSHVNLRISNTDFATIMETVLAEAFFWIFIEMTEAELNERIYQDLIEGMKAEDAPTREVEYSMRLELYEGAWKIVLDEALADALTGGMLSFAEYAAAWTGNVSVY